MKKEKHFFWELFLSIFRGIYETIRTCIILTALVLVVMYAAGIRPYVVRSGSMEPAILTGSVCFVNHHARYEEIQTGDVIAFRFGANDMATHRAIAIEPDGIRTKGDANETEDASLVTEELFLGETIFSIPNMGYLVISLRSRNGAVMLTAGVIMMLLIGRLLDSASSEEDEAPPE